MISSISLLSFHTLLQATIWRYIKKREKYRIQNQLYPDGKTYDGDEVRNLPGYKALQSIMTAKSSELNHSEWSSRMQLSVIQSVSVRVESVLCSTDEIECSAVSLLKDDTSCEKVQ